MQSLNAKQCRALDATAFASGFDVMQLMERAGLELANILEQRYSTDQTILFFCGPGGNGGDGLVACRYLINKGYQASVLLAQEKLSAPAAQNLRILEHMQVPIHSWSKGFELSPYDILVDCLLGYSQKAELRSPIDLMVEKMNASGKSIVACDIPTGMTASSGKLSEQVVKAEITVSFAAPKKAFGRRAELCGEILIVGIGIPGFVYEQLGLTEYLVEGVEKYK